MRTAGGEAQPARRNQVDIRQTAAGIRPDEIFRAGYPQDLLAELKRRIAGQWSKLHGFVIGALHAVRPKQLIRIRVIHQPVPERVEMLLQCRIVIQPGRQEVECGPRIIPGKCYSGIHIPNDDLNRGFIHQEKSRLTVRLKSFPPQ